MVYNTFIKGVGVNISTVKLSGGGYGYVAKLNTIPIPVESSRGMARDLSSAICKGINRSRVYLAKMEDM